MIGTSLNHYQITAKLGAGGMAEVYRARGGDIFNRIDCLRAANCTGEFIKRRTCERAELSCPFSFHEI